MATTIQDPPPELPAVPSSSNSTKPTRKPTPNRLSLPFDQRLLLSTFAAFTCGTFLGYTTTARLAGLRFRAENAHRLPLSQPGWYLYHKSKNYYKLRHGIPAGLRSGLWLASWTGLFFIIEESMDVFRGTWRAGRSLQEMEGVNELEEGKLEKCIQGSRDFLSSGVAGMVTGGLWSVWNGFPVVTAARTIKIGVLAGFGYGIMQDGLTWARGRSGGVVNQAESWIYRGAKNRRKKEEGDGEGDE